MEVFTVKYGAHSIKSIMFILYKILGLQKHIFSLIKINLT